MKKLMMSAVCAMMAAATFAEPKVEITEAYQETPGSGIVNYTYTISGLKTVTDLYIKVGAEGCSTTRTLTFTNVKEGTVTASVNATELLGQAYPNVTLFAELEDGVQLWENGPYFAKANVGATKPEEYGWYFWWGDTTGYKLEDSKWVSVTDSSKTTTFLEEDTTSNPSCNKNISTLKSTGWINFHSGNLDPVHDAATAKLGGPWRMMTLAEQQKLVSTDYCQHEYVTEYKGKSVNGLVVKGKKGSVYENNEVFFPVTGYGANSQFFSYTQGFYWSSTPFDVNPKHAYCIYFSKSKDPNIDDPKLRALGMPIRAVR